MRFAFAMAIGAAVLGGCATIPEDQCAKTDWYELGLKDGRAGYTAERVVQHREACAGVKIEPDELLYLQDARSASTSTASPRMRSATVWRATSTAACATPRMRAIIRRPTGSRP